MDQSHSLNAANVAKALGALVVLVVLAGALAPHDPALQYFGHQDKLEHASAFFVLGLLFGWAASPRGLLLAASGLVVLVFGIEALQALLTLTRTPSWTDAAASLLGLGWGLLCATIASGLARAAAITHGPNAR